jgi:predicted TIM-barrel enzyme
VSGATSLPTLIGSGVTAENGDELMHVADGVIIGSSSKFGGVWWRPVEQERASAFMATFTGRERGVRLVNGRQRLSPVGPGCLARD